MFNNLLFLFVFILFILKNNKATINKITNSENFTNKCKYYKTTLNNSELKNLKKGHVCLNSARVLEDRRASHKHVHTSLRQDCRRNSGSNGHRNHAGANDGQYPAR